MERPVDNYLLKEKKKRKKRAGAQELRKNGFKDENRVHSLHRSDGHSTIKVEWGAQLYIVEFETVPSGEGQRKMKGKIPVQKGKAHRW